MGTTTGAPKELVLDAAAIGARQRRPLEGLQGVERVTLWSHEDDYAGLLWLQPGSGLPEHSHEHAAHHVWVVDGAVLIDEQEVTAGSYWYIPPGCPHIVRAGSTGCQLFYLYLHD
jgi:mannose-6-phosphate isomerase-like protein (cupin superfamily)